MALVVAVVRDPKPFWLFCRSGYLGSNLFGYFVDRGVYNPAYFQFVINLRDPGCAIRATVSNNINGLDDCNYRE